MKKKSFLRLEQLELREVPSVVSLDSAIIGGGADHAVPEPLIRLRRVVGDSRPTETFTLNFSKINLGATV